MERWDWTWGRLDATAHIARLLNAPPQGADPQQVAELDPVIAEFEREVIKAEDKTVEDMQDELHRIAGDLGRSAGETDQPLLDALRATKSGRDALSALAESVSRFLAQDDPRLPRTLTTVASYARAAFDHWWRRMPFKRCWPGWPSSEPGGRSGAGSKGKGRGSAGKDPKPHKSRSRLPLMSVRASTALRMCRLSGRRPDLRVRGR